jgi:hypothetical protein
MVSEVGLVNLILRKSNEIDHIWYNFPANRAYE